MYDYSNNSNGLIKKSSNLFNILSKQNYKNSYLLESLISDLYEDLIKLVPERIAAKASINSRDTFEYFLDYSVEKTKLVLNCTNNVWSLCYRVFPSYLYDKNKFKNNKNISHVDRIVVHLNDFFTKNVKKYYN